GAAGTRKRTNTSHDFITPGLSHGMCQLARERNCALKPPFEAFGETVVGKSKQKKDGTEHEKAQDSIDCLEMPDIDKKEAANRQAENDESAKPVNALPQREPAKENNQRED